jgi:tetratricopeptide (TPR) repeat protein
MKRRLSSIHLVLALIALGLSACGKSPQQWVDYGKARASQGEHQRAVAAFDKALAKPGPWASAAQLERARSLFALRRWPDAERSAEKAANGLDAAAARPALVLALQACAEGDDRPAGKSVLGRLGTDAALKDPAVMAAAVKLGLAGAIEPAATVKAAMGQPAGVKAAVLPPSKNKVPVSQLDAVRIGIGAVGQTDAPGPEFDQAAQFQDPREVVKVRSPDGHWLVWRALDKSGYWLYLQSAQGGRASKLAAGKNGYQPVWSPDSEHILFSAMDWQTEERNLFILDLATRQARRAFKAAHKVGPLAGWSPDGRKIVFIYAGNLWVMNASGIGRVLLDVAGRIGKPVDDAALIGFSRDGQRIVYRSRNDPLCRVIDLAPRI